MKKVTSFFIIGFILVILGAPLGYISVNILNSIVGNLASEYLNLLNGFIYSYVIGGVLIFMIGLVNKLTTK